MGRVFSPPIPAELDPRLELVPSPGEGDAGDITGAAVGLAGDCASRAAAAAAAAAVVSSANMMFPSSGSSHI